MYYSRLYIVMTMEKNIETTGMGASERPSTSHFRKEAMGASKQSPLFDIAK